MQCVRGSCYPYWQGVEEVKRMARLAADSLSYSSLIQSAETTGKGLGYTQPRPVLCQGRARSATMYNLKSNTDSKGAQLHYQRELSKT